MEALIGIAILAVIVLAYFKVGDWFGTAVDRVLDGANKVADRRRAEQRAAEASDPDRKPGALTRALAWLDKQLDKI